MSDEAPPPAPPPTSRLAGIVARYWRYALLVVGAVAIALVVRKVGPKSVLEAVVTAGPFLPLLMTLEATWMGMDVFVLRALLGDRARRAPWRAYVRSAIAAYAINILFPAGRASAEAARAGMLSPYLGATNVAAAAVAIQGTSLLANSLISIVALSVLVPRLGASDRLVEVVGASAVICAVAGTVLSIGARHGGVRRFLRARLEKFREIDGAERDGTERPLRALALSFLGRGIQASLYGVALFAVTGWTSPARALTAQAISLSGSTFGDVVPQQAGVIEGAFYYFASAIDLRDHPERAVAVALVIRTCLLSLATLSLIVSSLWRDGARDEARQPKAAAR